MTFYKSKKSWLCNDCAYEILEKDFLDDFVFWFCDECNAYLNCQEGFDKKSAKHICQECGYENDTTFQNIKGICVDCDKLLPNPDDSLCDECKQIRIQKAKEWIAKTGKVVGATVIAAGTTYLASQIFENKKEFEKWLSSASTDELSDAYEVERLDWIKNGYNNGTGEKTPLMKILDTEISKRAIEEWKNNPNRNTDPNYRWTDANRWDRD